MWVCSPWPSSVPDGHSRGNICEQTIALWVLGLIHLLALGPGQCWWLMWDVEFQVGGGCSSNTRAVFYSSVQCRSWCPLAPDPWGAGWNVPLECLRGTPSSLAWHLPILSRAPLNHIWDTVHLRGVSCRVRNVLLVFLPFAHLFLQSFRCSDGDLSDPLRFSFLSSSSLCVSSTFWQTSVLYLLIFDF